MNDHLISLYIDNELDLDEKRDFVDAIATDTVFHRETCDLLEQEKILREGMALSIPATPTIPIKKKLTLLWNNWYPSLAGFSAALVLLAVILNLQPQPPVQVLSGEAHHRFVLYLPEAKDAAVVGTFTGWSPVPMEQIGNTGYWSLDLNLQPGEHRYSYLVGDTKRIADPTIQNREFDDFGGENSIINIGSQI